MAESARAKKSSCPWYEKETERVAQRVIDRSVKSLVRDKETSGAMQAGARLYPVPLPDAQAGRRGRSRTQASAAPELSAGNSRSCLKNSFHFLGGVRSAHMTNPYSSSKRAFVAAHY